VHLKQHGVLPDKSKIKLFKTSTTGVNVMLGFLNGQVKLHCKEKSRDEQIPEALVKNISKRIEEKDSPIALPRLKKNKNITHSLRQTANGGKKKYAKCRSYINCSVIGCGARSNDESKPSFFRFPARNREQREAWLSIVGHKNAGMSDWVPRNSDRICSHHFENGKYSTRRDRVNYIPTLNVGLSNWKPTFNFQTLKLNFSNLDEEEMEKEPALVEEPATKEIEIQCDLWQEFVEEKFFTFECQFIGISEKGTQLTTSRPTNIKATSNLVPVRLDKFLKFNKRAGPNKSAQGRELQQ
jgi:hypothetical protein